MTLSGPVSEIERCILELEKIGAFKFGEFTLKSGNKSPVYFDLRVIISFPSVLELVSNLIWGAIKTEKADFVCGVPYTALPIATVLSVNHGLPMLIRRKESKNYGTKKILEGVYSKGQSCLIIEDVIVSGSSVVETVELLRSEGLVCDKAVVFLDREQGGQDNLTNNGVDCTAVVTISQVLKVLHKFSKIDDNLMDKVTKYLSTNSKICLPSSVAPVTNKRESLLDRAAKSSNALVRRLLGLMDSKKTNLCVAVDVRTTDELLRIADQIGPHICILKTHIDILTDFSSRTVDELKNLSSRHDFLIFEDRKFADIENTVKLQYSSGVYGISNWAHLVTVHGLPGPGVIRGLKNCGDVTDRGCIIVAQMSSEGNLINQDYVKGCVAMLEAHRDFIVGFVSQSPVVPDSDVVLFTPGVSLKAARDDQDQRYVTPEDAILKRNADVIIVGRGITAEGDVAKAAAEYRKRGYEALLSKTSS